MGTDHVYLELQNKCGLSPFSVSHLAATVQRFGVALIVAGSLSYAMAQPPTMAELSRRPDNTGTGAYAAMKEEVSSLPDHVVYRPADLSALGTTKLGLVAWANGGCSPDAAIYRFHLLELASHGYLVIASGKILSGPGAPPREPGTESQRLPETAPVLLTDALDWAFAENARTDSPYYGRIATAQVAVSGASCGGAQAIDVAGDPRITTLVLHNTGIRIEPTSSVPGTEPVKNPLEAIHTPTIFIQGEEPNRMDNYQRIDDVPIAIANLIGSDHSGTFWQENGGVAAQVAVKWLEWQLRGDAAAASYFMGADCGICKDPAWSYESKRLVP